MGRSSTLEAGVDTGLEDAELGRLEEAEVGRLQEVEVGRLEGDEVGILDRGELGEEAGSATSGRYGLLWVFMGKMQSRMGMDEGVHLPARRAFVLGEKA